MLLVWMKKIKIAPLSVGCIFEKTKFQKMMILEYTGGKKKKRKKKILRKLFACMPLQVGNYDNSMRLQIVRLSKLGRWWYENTSISLFSKISFYLVVVENFIATLEKAFLNHKNTNIHPSTPSRKRFLPKSTTKVLSQQVKLVKSQEWRYQENIACTALMFISDALRHLVPFVQFKKRKKHPWRNVTFSKLNL